MVCPYSGLASLDQCFCIHGDGTAGLQFYSEAKNYWHSGHEIGRVLCAARCFVRHFPLQCLVVSMLMIKSSFIIQIVGAIKAVRNNKSPSQLLLGIHIYMVGVSLNIRSSR
jgi:hypothetical protein